MIVVHQDDARRVPQRSIEVSLCGRISKRPTDAHQCWRKRLPFLILRVFTQRCLQHCLGRGSLSSPHRSQWHGVIETFAWLDWRHVSSSAKCCKATHSASHAAHSACKRTSTNATRCHTHLILISISIIVDVAARAACVIEGDRIDSIAHSCEDSIIAELLGSCCVAQGVVQSSIQSICEELSCTTKGSSSG